MEDTKNKDAKKEKESPELKEELSEDKLKGLSGGAPTAVGELRPPPIYEAPILNTLKESIKKEEK